jgi:dipeptidyl aminopeptidase/acylaminoacyl peptidase
MIRGSVILRIVASCLITLAFIGTVDASDAVGKHLVTFSDLETLRQVEYSQLSPDGETLAYTAQGELWLTSTKQGSLPRLLGKGILPLWAPDSRHLAYYSKESGSFQLWLYDLENAQTKQITQFEGGIDPDPRMSAPALPGWGYDALRYSWSPDSSKIVFPSRVNSLSVLQSPADRARDPTSRNKEGEPLVLTRDTPPAWTLNGVLAHEINPALWVNWEKTDRSNAGSNFSTPRALNQLFIVDTGTESIEQFTMDQGGYFNPNWSPDGQKIVCASSEGRTLTSDATDRGRANIFVIDVTTRKKAQLTDGRMNHWLPYWSHDGKWILFTSAEPLGMRSISVVPSKGGSPSNVTSALDRNISVSDNPWCADNASIIVTYRDGATWPITRVDVLTHRVEEVSWKDAVFRHAISVSRSGILAWIESNDSTQSVVKILAPGATRANVLVDLNPQIAGWELGSEEVVRWSNDRGESLEGILLKPVGYEPGRRYPLIVDCYPNNTIGFPGLPMYGNQAWASMRYVVFFPGPRSPVSWMGYPKSQKFSEASKGPGGWDVTLSDVMSGVDELVGRGIVDADRMGLYGFSNGGGVVSNLITKTNRFKCAVAVAGSYPDWIRPFFFDFQQNIAGHAGGTPFDNPQAYLQLSAVFRLKSVTTPVLLAAGDIDVEALLGMIEMYNGLRWLNRDVVFLRYPDQYHGFTGAALADFWARETAFFAKYLKPEQTPN